MGRLHDLKTHDLQRMAPMSAATASAPHRTGPRPRRAAWRQWLVEAERGITAAFRSDSIFFVHLFVSSLVVAAAFLLGLSATQWAILTLALTITIAAELFHQVLKALMTALEPIAPGPVFKARRLAVAAVAATTFGSGVTAAFVFSSRLWAAFSG